MHLRWATAWLCLPSDQRGPSPGRERELAPYPHHWTTPNLRMLWATTRNEFVRMFSAVPHRCKHALALIPLRPKIDDATLSSALAISAASLERRDFPA